MFLYIKKGKPYIRSVFKGIVLVITGLFNNLILNQNQLPNYLISVLIVYNSRRIFQNQVTQLLTFSLKKKKTKLGFVSEYKRN